MTLFNRWPVHRILMFFGNFWSNHCVIKKKRKDIVIKVSVFENNLKQKCETKNCTIFINRDSLSEFKINDFQSHIS